MSELSDKMKQDLITIATQTANDCTPGMRQFHVATMRALKLRGLVEYKDENPWSRVTLTETGKQLGFVQRVLGSEFNVYINHKGAHVILPTVTSVDEVRELAEAAVELGHDAFYRVFERTSESVTGEQFVIAFSVLDGVITERDNPLFPEAHSAWS